MTTEITLEVDCDQLIREAAEPAEMRAHVAAMETKLRRLERKLLEMARITREASE